MTHKLIGLILIYYLRTIFADSICGDWDSYRDEKCFKIFESLGLKTYNESVVTCEQQNSSSLISIGSIEEQNFILNYLFTTHKIVDNIWLGLKYENSVYKWSDSSNVNFTYWAENNPKNRTDFCAQINADLDLHGKWSDVNCSKKNVVVCQMMPTITLTLIEIQNILLTMRKKVESLEKNPVPLGFIYVQLPNQSDPHTLWPTVEWKEISQEYDSLFFRVAGKNSSVFGNLQEEKSPRIYNIWQNGGNGCTDDLWIDNSLEMGSFGELCTASAKGGGSALRFSAHGGEVRPRNTAVKIFKRIA